MLTVYSSKGCTKCEVLKAFLEKQGIEFTEVAATQRAMVDLIKAGVLAPVANVDLPVVVKDGHGYVGFTPEDMLRLGFM